MKVENWALKRVKPYPGNPRENSDAVAHVMRSIDEFGFRQPIVVDAGGIIIAGHTRYRAAKKLKLRTVPVHVAKGLSPDQVRAYRIADNKSADLSRWNDERLAVELEAIAAGEYDVTLSGFSEKEVAKLLKSYDPSIEPADTTPEPLDNAVRCPKCGHTFPV